MRLNFISDPGHGWLVVDRKHVVELGIAPEISPYSYQKGDIAYLEEDCDAGLYLQALKAKGITYTIAEQSLNDDAPCRRFQRFHIPLEEQIRLDKARGFL